VEYARWLESADLHDTETHARVERLLAWTANEKITVAVVGEFSRGKSELINALFASGGYFKRLLPSFPGRSTMCPTELQWDDSEPPSMRLLPIETRSDDSTLSELKQRPEVWQVVPLDPNDPEGLVEGFHHLTQTRRVSRNEAMGYGLLPAVGQDSGADEHAEQLEIPCWRHAVVNFPHPLLAQGLVIFDTPGLNVIGTEPELTLNLLPSAQALVFLLSIDTGVTQTDLHAWKNHLVPLRAGEAGCLVVLNKVDTLWDGLRSDDEIREHVCRLVGEVSEVLNVDSRRVLPVSAQKGLVAHITGDDTLLARSGLGALEQALASELIPARHEIVRDAVRREFDALAADAVDTLSKRLELVRAELDQLRAAKAEGRAAGLRAFAQARREKDELTTNLAHFRQVKRYFSEYSNKLYAQLGPDAVRGEERRTLAAMTQSYFTAGLRGAMADYFDVVESRMITASQIVEELHAYMERIYVKYEQDFQLRVGHPRPLSLVHWTRELRSASRIYQRHFDTLTTMVANEQVTLTRKFFRTLAAQVRKIYSLANYECTNWLRALIAPLERQVKERQSGLLARLYDVKQMLASSDALEARLDELEAAERRLDREVLYAQGAAVRLEEALEGTHDQLPEAA
jgi:hypothetical protein